MEDLDKRLEGLSPAKRELLLRKLGRSGTVAVDPIPVRGLDDRGELSFSQQRLWFVHELSPASAAYNLAGSLTLSGSLDVEALALALTEVSLRHENLRSSFPAELGRPRVVIHPPTEFALEVLDLTGLPAAQRAERVETEERAEATKAFDLAAAPPWRARLMRLGPRRHRLVFVMHHILADAWSGAVFVKELGAIYNARRTGAPVPLRPLALQYGDYAAWQRRKLERGRFERDLLWWRDHLRGLPPLELPTDRPRSADTSRGGHHGFLVEATTTARLTEVARREGATLFMVLAAVLGAVLYRWTGQRALAMGTPVAGRTRGELEDLIGLFVNTVVLRVEVDPDETFLDLVRSTKNEALSAFSHAEVPFERVVEAVATTRETRRPPLFEVMLSLQNAPTSTFDLVDLSVELAPIRTATAKFPLSVTIGESRGGLFVDVEYASDLFDAATAARLSGHLQSLLRGAAARPETRVSDLPLLTEAERALTVAWSDTRTERSGSETIHGLFEVQLARTPISVAVDFGTRQLTYEQLEARANRLAHYLRSVGVGPDVLVGLCLDRSLEMVVALLGILKAGGAYLPLDPEHPSERLAWMISDAQPVVILTDAALRHVLPPGSNVVCLDANASWTVGQGDRPVSSVRGDNAAYVIYTSGSTGRPKGVVVAHGAATNLLTSAAEQLHFTSADSILALTTLSFDIALVELMLPLVVGGRSVIASRQTATDGRALISIVREKNVTVVQATPAMWRLLLDAGFRGGDGLKTISTGEALPSDLPGSILPAGNLLWNMYGPTETCVWSAFAPVTNPHAPIVIGRPMANTTLRVLDERLQVLPSGCLGELYIGGVGLARGYLARPDLTADRFVPDPHSSEAGARMYRTGDLARWTKTGELECVGRVDHQVKIRGYRIELGEIEAALSSASGARSCAVVAREDVPGDKRLVAYVVGSDDAPVPSAASMLTALRRTLPDYMLPSAFVTLDALPLTASGKLDRKALPAPRGTRSQLAANYVPPRSHEEEVVAGIWGEVLGLERVGASDNFFEMGGHSLLATQVISRLHRALGVEVSLRKLFESPTVAAIAAEISSKGRQVGGGEIPILLRAPHTAVVPVSFAQRRLWFLDQLDPGGATYNMPAALRVRGPLAVESLRRAVEAIVARHEVLRTTFAPAEGDPIQRIHPPAPWELADVDLAGCDLEERECEISRRAREEAATPFDLTSGPLLRTSLLRLGDSEHVFILTMHHVISDAWSIGVFVYELAAHYDAYAAGREPELPPLHVQYADYTLWQRGWLAGELLERHLEYWRDRVSGLPVLELPTDRPHPLRPSSAGATLTRVLSSELALELRKLSRTMRATLYMTLLGAFEVLLHKYTGQTRFGVGTVVANRKEPELAPLIGFFVNTLVMCADLASDPSFLEVMERVREDAFGAYAHEHVPLERVVEAARVSRDPRRSPLFQVMFDLQNAPRPAMALPGLSIETLPLDALTAKFDLSCSVEERGDELVASFEYSTDIFDAETVARMANHFATLLRSIVSGPERRISELAMLTEAEQDQLRDWSVYPLHASASAEPGRRAHELFGDAAQRTPDAVAVVEQEREVSYRELDDRSDRVARELARRNVGRGTRVAVCAERSIETIATILGILKVGAAYVPLDPLLPRERLLYQLDDAGTTVVTADAALALPVPYDVIDVKWLARHSSREEAARERLAGPHVPPRSPDADGAAYVIYTSGSTGQPKGVVVPHVALASFIDAALYHYGLTAADRVLQFAALTFDASVEEIFVPLAAGARVVLRDDAMLGSARRFLAGIEQHGISVASLPTAWWAGITDILAGEGRPIPQSLHTLIIGGEEARPGSVAAWRRLAPRVRLINTYGPTESTVEVTLADLSAFGEGVAHSEFVPIGRPMKNSRAYVLDSHLAPVPIGVAGELCIAGASLAHGYLGRHDVTAERFVPDPYANGGRMYRTGDRARWRSDGQLEFLGRVDHQIKLRGFRIEPGEVEAAISRHPAVSAAVVGVREDLMLAWWVPAGDGVTTESLQAHLRAQLPTYLRPSILVRMESFPLTSNGKIDRRALPDREVVARTGAPVIAKSPTERMIADIWCDVLGLQQISVDDNFFDLGGHSLLATQVLSRMEKALGVELSVRALFEEPTVAGLSQVVDSSDAGMAPTAQRLVPRPREGAVPLSFAQQRLWFLGQLDPGSPTYNMPAALRVVGSFDVEPFRRAVETIVARHEALRTTFREEADQPVQHIHPAVPWTLGMVDLETSNLEEREAELKALVHAEAVQPFDLSTGPLLRTRIVRLNEGEHVVLITMHHIVSDGWSLGVFVRELAALYGAYAQGSEPDLPPLPVQYADYTLWQRSWLTGEGLTRHLDYWREHLTGLPTLELPTDRSRPVRPTHSGAVLTRRLPRTLTDALRQLARRCGSTLYMTLLAAFEVLLHRYSGQQSFGVGTAIANRTERDLEPLIGFFVNTLVMRADLSADPSFLELADRVRRDALGAYSHQAVPFEQVVEALGAPRDLRRNPLFDVMFVLQNAPATDLALTGATLEPLPPTVASAKFDLTLSIEELEHELVAAFEYATDLFDGETIDRMSQSFESLLRAVVARPESPISELPVLTEPQRQEVLVAWNATDIDYPESDGLHGLFEAQVLRTPANIAVEIAGECVTYHVLNGRANQLARHLSSRGVGPDALVGICGERSIEMVAAMLAVLKAGGAYVPLDPDLPDERLAMLLSEADVRIVITMKVASARIPSSLAVVEVDAPWFETCTESLENLDDARDADHLAYVVYTSGSTGVPKGVGVSHRSICNHMRWMQSTFPLESDDIVLQKTSFGFDASVWEFYAPLMAGARLAMAPPGVQRDPANLVRCVKDSGATVLQVVPTLLSALLDEDLQSCTVLRRVYCGGEALPVELQTRFRACSSIPLINLYGPTETTIDATFWRTDGTDSIGHPIANLQAYTLDEKLEPTPVGVPGELYVAGAGLARGYWRRPDLTAEAFLPDPHSPTPGARMYRTGDRARWRSNGTLQFLGRLDSQTKIRGYRVEPLEVESALSSRDSVRSCAVIAREDIPGDVRLVAYVVPSDPASPPTASALRAALQAVLPEYMVPWNFVMLESLPSTTSGKVDRKALPVPDAHLDGAVYVAPRNDWEVLIASVWSDLLGLDRVGVNDNFFELGGHSLLAARALSRVNTALGIAVPVRAMFEDPTVAGLSRRIELAQFAAGPRIPRLQPTPRSSAPPLSFAQERLWFLDRLDPNSASYNVPAALRIGGHLDAESLRRAIESVVSRHEVLRTTITESDGQPQQRIHPPIPWTWSVLADVEGSPSEREKSVASRIMVEGSSPFDLSAGPLFRASLLRLRDVEHVLLITMHHVIADGWSVAVLVREIASMYDAYAAGLEADIPPLNVQYADYAVWQRSWLEGELLDQQIEYWRGRLDGIPVLDLPTDRPHPAQPTHAGASITLVVPAALTAALRRLSRAQGSTLYMTLLAGFEALLHRHCGQSFFGVGTAIANRPERELEPLIGCFVNTLVMRADLSSDPTFVELVERVRSDALGAYAHQSVPFERLVDALHAPRDLRRNPVFQVMFMLQNGPLSELALSGVTVESLPLATDTAKFDLSVSVDEREHDLVATFEYATDLFDAPTVARLAGHFETLLQAAVAGPDQRVSEIELLTLDERRQLLALWNDTTEPYPEEQTIHGLFEAQAAKTPGRVAVELNGNTLTYAELDARATQLANRLRSAGVGPEVIVGLCVERSVEMVVGLLGILKSGGAYLPLDPEYPSQRLQWMVDDSQPRVILTQESLREAIPAAPVVLCMDGAAHVAGGISSAWQSRSLAGPANSAYVIYTSGSTGKPKGVVVPHRAAVNFLTTTAARLAIDATDSCLAVTTLSFDIAVLELYLPLTVGARVVLAPRETSADGGQLRRALKVHGITLLQATPATWSILAEAGFRGEPRLKALVGGEALPPALATRLLPFVDELWNMYGPTETCVWSTCARVTDEAAPIVIGRPLGNTVARVLDERLGLVPVGCVGELYIGGAGVARGYLGRPDLTAERFVPDPYGSDPGGRLYRTGDRARWRAGGTLECIGRTDHQVKVRGHRIELGEVESALSAVAGVASCAVAAQDDPSGAKRLVAYVVAPRGLAGLTATAMRAELRTTLPDYMTPSMFVTLDALPRLPNGKVDRAVLPPPPDTRPELEQNYVAPRTPEEETVAAIWRVVLGVHRVGVRDNFFEMGGHSLLVTQVLARVSDAFGVDVPVRAMFEEPTIAGLCRCIAVARGAGRLSAPPIAPAAVVAEAQLSFGQSRLWFLTELAPGSPVYNIPLALRFTGVLDSDALQWSTDQIVARHESLRTTISSAGGQPIQVISPTGGTTVTVLDLRSEGRFSEGDLLRIIVEEGHRPFDLGRGPLLRASLLRLGDEDHVVLFTMHHVISDGWSMNVFVRELAAHYESFGTGRAAPLASLPIQYRDFAAWQREFLQGSEFDRLLRFWRGALSGELAPLRLPTTRHRPVELSTRGASHPVSLPSDVSLGLGALGRSEGVTPFMALLSAYYVLLYRITGCADLRVGTPVAGRGRAELEPLIGFFVNTLVLRTDVSGEQTFRQLLRRVRATALAAYEHQEMPFERLVEILRPERDLGHTPIFQVGFTFNADDGSRAAPVGSFGGLALEWIEVPSEVARFELGLTLTATSRGIDGVFEYNRDLFTPDTIARISEQFARLTEGALADPDRPITSLAMLSEAERIATIGWNQTAWELGIPRSIPSLVEEQAARTPHAVAVRFDGATLSYRDLCLEARRLATTLRERGVRGEDRVGVCFERSLEMVVVLLAVMSAGGTCVPLDPVHPQERLSFMLSDCGATIVVMAPAFACRFSSHETLVFALPASAASSDVESVAQEPPRSDADQAAFVMYTSGSTGRPKGVVLTHGSLFNRLAWGQLTYPLGTDDRVLQNHSFGFDVAIWEFFGPLIAGAATVLARPLGHQDPTYLAELITAERITAANFVPSMLDVFLHEERVRECVTLRRVFAGGEALSPDLVRIFRGKSNAELHNLYGPTEASLAVSAWACPRKLSEAQPVLIGKPIANVQIHVLDAHMTPVPVDVTGELYLGGASLARGYEGRADLTAERFVPDPFRGDGARLYRSGDLGRWTSDGNLEYLGRRDDQVKVRGVRIELGEIETVLREQPAIADAAVIAIKSSSQGASLAAFVVARTEDRPSTQELRSHLRIQLSEAMVPTRFAWLDALPLTAHGKLDRAALARLEVGVEARTYVAPRTATEAVVARAFAELLGIADVGVTDDFFNLGGHSLLATRLIANLRSHFGVDLPLRTLFDARTVGELASRIGESGLPDNLSARHVRATCLVPLQTAGSEAAFFFVHAIGGSVFPYVELAARLGQRRPFYGIQARGFEAGDEPRNDIGLMAAAYVAEIRLVAPDGPYHLGGWSMGGCIAFEMARQLLEMGETVAELVLVDSWPSADLERLPSDAAANTSYSAELRDHDRVTIYQELRSHEGVFGEDLSGFADVDVRRIASLHRAHLGALRRWAPRAVPLPVFVVAAAGASDRAARLRAAWGPLSAGVTLEVVRGDHYSMFDSEHVGTLAATLERFAALAVADSRPERPIVPPHDSTVPVGERPLPRPTARIPYGPSAEQFGELHVPPGVGPHPVVLALHGGFWRPYNLAQLTHLCDALTRAGFAVWSLEFRRLGCDFSGYRGTHEDVRRGLDALLEFQRQYALDLDGIIAIGHSVGAQLALSLAHGCAASSGSLRLGGIITLAGVTDLRQAFTQGLGAGAVQEFLGGTPNEVPTRYDEISPIELLPLGLPHILIHGSQDDVVPMTMSYAYAKRATSLGDRVSLEVMEGVGHFDLIEPDSPSWPIVLAAVRSLARC